MLNISEQMISSYLQQSPYVHSNNLNLNTTNNSLVLYNTLIKNCQNNNNNNNDDIRIDFNKSTSCLNNFINNNHNVTDHSFDELNSKKSQLILDSKVSTSKLKNASEKLHTSLSKNFTQHYQQASAPNLNNVQISASLLNEYLKKNFSNNINSNSMINVNNYYHQYYGSILNQQGSLRNSNSMATTDELALQSGTPEKVSLDLQNELLNYYKLKQTEYFYLQQQSNNFPSELQNNLKIIQNFSNEFLQLYLSQQHQSQSCDLPASVNNDVLNRFINYSKNSNYYTTYLQQYQQTVHQLANNGNYKYFNINKSRGEQIENSKDEKISFEHKLDTCKEKPFIPYKKRAFNISQDEITINSDGDSNSISNETNESVSTVNMKETNNELVLNTKKPKSSNKEKLTKKSQFPNQPKKIKRCPHVWQFCSDLLDNDKYNPSIIKWLNKEKGIFKIVKPDLVAELWGCQKNRKTDKKMNYEKMARGMRYSRREGFFKKLDKEKNKPNEYGKQLVFQFSEKVVNNYEWKWSFSI